MISNNEILYMRIRLADLPPGKQIPLDVKTLLELCELSLVALFAFKHTELQHKVAVSRLENKADDKFGIVFKPLLEEEWREQVADWVAPRYEEGSE